MRRNCPSDFSIGMEERAEEIGSREYSMNHKNGKSLTAEMMRVFRNTSYKDECGTCMVQA